ncbi:MerR family transcriptional regulator [Pseudomonas helleri]|jgi:DNA-binding transcriptional MerR regulator|uniref:MerR family transcriptional regulator n=1 Tax=Pseudomonas helleri TaxID=1608996 RepID=A0A6A7Z9F8_9PSED|nr:MerR family transcriptional regulator [Pseudomonas helleri]MQT36101.1 MerR family transcriptional regulator [Pseudomonas helleri]MQU20897.1 MerR family transcriptional regulator [Pseudomonas helleri]MQU44261.1 MerR family transcriptional regulator [Pseudomonas helleri]MQU57586.1 MerR family transcriptional regulator [Pseudomonas helleri]
MYIGKAAQLSGTTIKSIRHYEAIGLLPSPQRQGKYRIYSQHSVEWLKLIKCAQQLGFKLKEMLAIVENHPRQPLPWEVVSNAIEVKKNAVARQIEALQQVQAQLVEFETRFKDASQTVSLGCDP